jgi:hypothetical protein
MIAVGMGAVVWGTGSLRLRNALKSKSAVILICLFLFIAAVDTIPDPPAINPPKSHSCSMSALHAQGPLTLLETEWCLAAGSVQRDVLLGASYRCTLEIRPLGICSTPLVHHAADVSPPVFS